MTGPTATASQGQYCSGFSEYASTSRLDPFISNTIPPTYQTMEAKILRVRMDAVSIVDQIISAEQASEESSDMP
jgi:hypothetical protein